MRLGMVVFVGLMLAANMGSAQACGGWVFTPEGGYESDMPEAYSRCEGFGTLALLCSGSALTVSFTPAEEPAEAKFPDGFAAISYGFPGQVYSDVATYYAATGEFALLRHVWDSGHPFFEAFQANAFVRISMPTIGVNGSVSLGGSRAAIGQVIAACQAG